MARTEPSSSWMASKKCTAEEGPPTAGLVACRPAEMVIGDDGPGEQPPLETRVSAPKSSWSRSRRAVSSPRSASYRIADGPVERFARHGGLGEVVLGADFERLVTADPVVETSEDDRSRGGARLVQQVQGVEALRAWKAEVEQSTVEWRPDQCADRLGDVLDPGDVVIPVAALEEVTNEVRIARVVLDQQDALGSVGHRPSSLRFFGHRDPSAGPTRRGPSPHGGEERNCPRPTWRQQRG